LAWSVPMYDPTYWSPSAAIHSFMMFAPFFVMKKNMVIQGFFLWLAGPFAASMITPNLQEQASIWCFFSIAQIGIMLYIIRESLILGWGRNTADKKTSLFKKHEANGSHTNGTHTNGSHTNGTHTNGTHTNGTHTNGTHTNGTVSHEKKSH